MTTVRVFKNGTNVRLGGAIDGDPDNIVTTVDAGEFDGLVQCVGEEVIEGPNRNRWWVLIASPAGTLGWVNAVRIATTHQDNDKPIPDVPHTATEFYWQERVRPATS